MSDDPNNLLTIVRALAESATIEADARRPAVYPATQFQVDGGRFLVLGPRGVELLRDVTRLLSRKLKQRTDEERIRSTVLHFLVEMFERNAWQPPVLETQSVDRLLNSLRPSPTEQTYIFPVVGAIVGDLPFQLLGLTFVPLTHQAVRDGAVRAGSDVPPPESLFDPASREWESVTHTADSLLLLRFTADDVLGIDPAKGHCRNLLSVFNLLLSRIGTAGFRVCLPGDDYYASVRVVKFGSSDEFVVVNGGG